MKTCLSCVLAVLINVMCYRSQKIEKGVIELHVICACLSLCFWRSVNSLTFLKEEQRQKKADGKPSVMAEY